MPTSWPRGLDKRSSIAAGVLLLVGAATIWVSEALPWAVATSTSGRTTTWIPQEAVATGWSTALLGLSAFVFFAFGLNRLGVRRLWPWLQVSALWPMLVAYEMVTFVNNEGMSHVSGSYLSFSTSRGIGQFVCSSGIGVVIFAIIIEFQSRRRFARSKPSRSARRRQAIH